MGFFILIEFENYFYICGNQIDTMGIFNFSKWWVNLPDSQKILWNLFIMIVGIVSVSYAINSYAFKQVDFWKKEAKDCNLQLIVVRDNCDAKIERMSIDNAKALENCNTEKNIFIKDFLKDAKQQREAANRKLEELQNKIKIRYNEN